MSTRNNRACVLNHGAAAWAFEDLAFQLAGALGIDVASSPRDYNYLLGSDRDGLPAENSLFISVETIDLASDKRLLATVFAQAGVPTPETHLLATMDAARDFVRANASREWCLKYPIGSGAAGHRLFLPDTPIPQGWPSPYVVQEFIRLETPEVYRAYAAAGQLFGWLVRRYRGKGGSPWVAHARGAQWENLGGIPVEVTTPARDALKAVNLLESFGCVDLLRRPDGAWVVLEVGTDGLVNHVDRDLGDPVFEGELLERISASFWGRFEQRHGRGA